MGAILGEAFFARGNMLEQLRQNVVLTFTRKQNCDGSLGHERTCKRRRALSPFLPFLVWLLQICSSYAGKGGLEGRGPIQTEKKNKEEGKGSNEMRTMFSYVKTKKQQCSSKF